MGRSTFGSIILHSTLSLSDALSVLMAAQNIQKKKVMIYGDLLCTNSFQRGCFVFAMSHLQKKLESWNCNIQTKQTFKTFKLIPFKVNKPMALNCVQQQQKKSNTNININTSTSASCQSRLLTDLTGCLPPALPQRGLINQPQCGPPPNNLTIAPSCNTNDVIPIIILRILIHR